MWEWAIPHHWSDRLGTSAASCSLGVCRRNVLSGCAHVKQKCRCRVKLLTFAQLVGDLAPEEVVRVIATVEGGDVGHPEGLSIGEASTILLAQIRVFRQQAKADEQVGLTATHSLLEVKDTLSRDAGESGHALADEVLHALGDVGLLEELGTVAFRSDQFVELLNLVAELNGECIGLKLAGASITASAT